MATGWGRCRWRGTSPLPTEGEPGGQAMIRLDHTAGAEGTKALPRPWAIHPRRLFYIRLDACYLDSAPHSV